MNLLDCNKHFSLVETRPVTSPQHDVHPLYMRRDRSRLYRMFALERLDTRGFEVLIIIISFAPRIVGGEREFR